MITERVITFLFILFAASSVFGLAIVIVGLLIGSSYVVNIGIAFFLIGIVFLIFGIALYVIEVNTVRK